jgi:hypothetical protein
MQKVTKIPVLGEPRTLPERPKEKIGVGVAIGIGIEEIEGIEGIEGVL